MTSWLKKEDSSSKKHIDFASIASHELRTPLSVIKWYTEILLDEDMGSLTDTQKKYIKVIESSNEKAIALVTALLNVSRVSNGTFSVSPEPLLITEVLEEVLKKHSSLVDEKNLVVSKKISDPFEPVLADRKIVFFILSSLIKNAFVFSNPSGKVTVSLSWRPSSIECVIQDYGLGIKEEEKKNIFSKLFRGAPLDEQHKGSGLSLYITKLLLEKVGGTIYFTSTYGEGSTFVVTFLTTGMKRRKGTTEIEI